MSRTGQSHVYCGVAGNGPSSSNAWLPMLARIAVRLSQGDHSLRFIDAVFDELAGPLALDAYLYYQAEKGGLAGLAGLPRHQ